MGGYNIKQLDLHILPSKFPAILLSLNCMDISNIQLFHNRWCNKKADASILLLQKNAYTCRKGKGRHNKTYYVRPNPNRPTKLTYWNDLSLRNFLLMWHFCCKYIKVCRFWLHLTLKYGKYAKILEYTF